MRHAARVDKAQAGIVAALRKIGASVVSLAAIGRGCPDLLVGYCGRNILMEVKSSAAKREDLTADQRAFLSKWRGQTAIVTDPEEAIRAAQRDSLSAEY